MKKHLRETLSETIPLDDLLYVCNSYEIIGDIAIIRLTETSSKYRLEIARALMSIHNNIKTVLAQVSSVHGAFRTRELEHVIGEEKTTATHIENKCPFTVDLKKCYFSPRLSYERMRIAKQIRDGETIVNMYAGVGCFSLIIAKHARPSRVYSIDANPQAVKLMQRNIRINGAYGKVFPLLGDAREVVENRLKHTADRVLMPLPEKAFEHLPYALSALVSSGGWIHYYDFEHATRNENPVKKVKTRVEERFRSLGAAFEIPYGRVVRSTGPNWFQIALDVKIAARHES